MELLSLMEFRSGNHGALWAICVMGVCLDVQSSVSSSLLSLGTLGNTACVPRTVCVKVWAKDCHQLGHLDNWLSYRLFQPCGLKVFPCSFAEIWKQLYAP